MRSDILVSGKTVPIDAPVIGIEDSGLSFPRIAYRKETRYLAFHWTASENRPEQIVRNMISRKTSVHFIVEPGGIIYQTADASVRCSHIAAVVDNEVRPAKVGSDFAVGVEMVNRGHALSLPSHGIRRVMIEEEVHGTRVKYGRFTAAQVSSAIALSVAICRAYQLPMVLPIDTKTGKVFASKLPDAFKRRFRGIAGHYHFDLGKIDPCPDLLQQIADALDPRPLPVA